MKAYVLIETSVGKTKPVKKALTEIDAGKRCQIVSQDAVTGPSDFIITLEGGLDDIGQFVTEKIATIAGVTRTTICLCIG